MPTVSVIIPNYNHATFLRRRFQSILNQTYQDFEIIFLDDASTDKSIEVFSEFAGDPRIRAFFNETNSGVPARQWNKGVRAAHGKYVWIAESDDAADERFLETLVGRLEHYPTAGLAYCQSWQVDAQNRRTGIFEAPHIQALDSRRWNDDYFNDGLDECQRFLMHHNTIPNASAVVFRKAIYEQAGYADESMRYCSDWLMWAKMLMHSDIVFVSEPLNYFRRYEGAFSGEKSLENNLTARIIPLRLAALYPHKLGSRKRDLKRWKALSYYIRGRLALRTHQIRTARSLFWQSVRVHPTPSALLFLTATLGGKHPCMWMDGLLSRHPLLSRLFLTTTKLSKRTKEALEKFRYPSE